MKSERTVKPVRSLFFKTVNFCQVKLAPACTYQVR